METARGSRAATRGRWHRVPLEKPVAEKGATWEAALMADLFSRITTKPGQCGGRPCVRGMRIRVTDVLDLLVSGLTPAEILDEMPDLEADDIRACVAYANRLVDHPVLAA